MPANAVTIAVAAALLLATMGGRADEPAGFAARVVAAARNEVDVHGAEYAVDREVPIPWRQGLFAKDDWKCNFFAMNVVYAAGGRVPAVAYGPGFRRLVSNYMYWDGRRLSREGQRKVAQSHYPLARDLANPTLFVTAIPVVEGGLAALEPGDLVFMRPPGDSAHGHCLVYLGERDGARLKCAFATESGAVIDFYDVEEEDRGYTIRRPRPGKTPEQ